MFIFASTNSDKLSCEQLEQFRKYRWRAAKTTPFPGPFSWLGVTGSENYVNLALAGFFAIEIKFFASSNLADTV